ncbi:hypothetical protein [Kineococcus rhizosphaerae]|uniref:hypothetical protein n=1 Tax=Kineococcus rhizosphaerae TaxID=559628 RepID=UPI001FEA6803|nr:hypothetical protein [Kineococcus rhizosphaerae]
MQQQTDAVASWWRQLAPALREDLLTLGPAEFLPEHLVRDLRAFAVDVPDVAVALTLGRNTYAVYAQPPVLQEFLRAARVWGQGWREP